MPAAPRRIPVSFESVDSDAVLGRMKNDRDLFSSAIVTLLACENFDNHRPAGLMEFLALFTRHWRRSVVTTWGVRLSQLATVERGTPMPVAMGVACLLHELDVAAAVGALPGLAAQPRMVPACDPRERLRRARAGEWGCRELEQSVREVVTRSSGADGSTVEVDHRPASLG